MSGQKIDHYQSTYGEFASDVYSDIRVRAFGTNIGQNGWLTSDEQDLFISWLHLDGRSRLLDVACGSGGPTLRIARITGCSAHGVDVHGQAIVTARSQAAASNVAGRVEFSQVEPSLSLPFEDDSFDALICVDAFNHMLDRPATLKDWARILRKGGRLVVTDPVVITGPVTSEDIALRSSFGNFQFLFVPLAITEAYLRESGFEIKHIEDRTANTAQTARDWCSARAMHEIELRKIEGDEGFESQQAFFSHTAKVASERRISRFAFCAERV